MRRPRHSFGLSDMLRESEPERQMIARLTVITALIALFGLSFAALAGGARPSHSGIGGTTGTCLERGLVCAE